MSIAAISSPLIESSIEGATGVVLNITGGRDLTLHEVNTAAETIYDIVDEDANIIFGAVVDEKMQGEVRVTVIATGFSGKRIPNEPAIKDVITPAKEETPTETSTSTTPETKESKSDSIPGLDIPEFLQRRRFPRS